MRARKFRPAFDRLDARLVLDGGGAVAVASLASSTVDTSTTSTTDPTNVVDWYLPGTPDASDGTTSLVASTN